MADRSVLTTSTFNDFRREVNGTARDVGNISDLLSASSYIASATDVVEAIVLLNAQLPEITTDAFIFPGRTMTFEGATDDAFETTLTFAEPTADRTHTLPDADGSILLTFSISAIRKPPSTEKSILAEKLTRPNASIFRFETLPITLLRTSSTALSISLVSTLYSLDIRYLRLL